MEARVAPLQERMADAIVTLLKARGYCHARDLEAHGFTPEEIGHCWAHANALAAVTFTPNYFNIVEGGLDERRYHH